MNLIKKYWDIISGIAAGLGLAFLSKFQFEKVQLCSSIIILVLVCIGMFRMVRQTVDKQREKKPKQRKHNLIDTMVDGHKSIKAISFAQEPTKEGEKLGKLFIKLLEANRKIMKKLKTFMDKYKGYISTVLLGLITVVENYGGYINSLCGGKLVIGEVEILPVITTGATVIVGILSNGFTKEQWQKIKTLFSKSSSDEIVTSMIKKSYKDRTAELTTLNKDKSTKETELETLNSELASLNNTLQAKKKMNKMIPQLATDDEVKAAQNAVLQCETTIKSKFTEIAEIKEKIEEVTTTINALKSQL